MKGKFFYQTLKSKLFSFNRCLQTILQARNKSSIISTFACKWIYSRRMGYGRTKQQICECRPQMVCVSACIFCDQHIGYLPFITLTTASNWNQPFQQICSASNILSHSFMVSLVGWPMASPSSLVFYFCYLRLRPFMQLICVVVTSVQCRDGARLRVAGEGGWDISH